LLANFSEHINSHFSFLKDKKLLIAVSGGLDSIVLSHLLHRLKFTVSLAHCNFRLRGKDADQDEVFVKELGNQLSVPVFTTSFETEKVATQEKQSIQVAARELRYKWFHEIIEENKLDFLLTAHHADDNLETFLINTIRGTGLDGLTGIPEKNENIIRPLLPFSREQIEKYAKDHSLKWREDSSNIETKYLRNKIRHAIIPILKELNPGLLSSFAKTQENLMGSRQIIEDVIAKVKNADVIPAQAGIQKINIAKLKEYSNPKAYLYELLKTYNFTEWNDVVNLLDAQSGKQVLSETHRLLKDRDFLLLTELHQESTEQNTYVLNESDTVFENSELKLILSNKNISNTGLNTPPKFHDSILIDRDKLKFPLTVRKWEKGDYFYPFGMEGKKKLSKFFKDEKISVLEKEKIWLLCSEDQIVWVIGKRLDDRFKITETTKNILKIENQ